MVEATIGGGGGTTAESLEKLAAGRTQSRLRVLTTCNYSPVRELNSKIQLVTKVVRVANCAAVSCDQA